MAKKKKKTKLDKAYKQEALDRVAMLSMIWQDFIVDHPTIDGKVKLSRQAAKVGEEIGKLYLMIP